MTVHLDALCFDARDPPRVVLADPDGNEFCVLTPR